MSRRACSVAVVTTRAADCIREEVDDDDDVGGGVRAVWVDYRVDGSLFLGCPTLPRM